MCGPGAYSAQIGRELLLMDFVAASKTDESNLPDPQKLLETAIEKAGA